MVESEPVLPMRAMSGSVWLMLLRKTVRTFLPWAAAWDRVAIRGLCKAGSTPHQLQHLEVWALHLTQAAQ